MKYINLYENFDFNEEDFDFEEEEYDIDCLIKPGDRINIDDDSEIIFWNDDKWSTISILLKNSKVINVKHSSEVTNNPNGDFGFKPITDDCYVFSLDATYWNWFKVTKEICKYINK